MTLASLHAAKGLEWDAVFLVGLVDGTLPVHRAGEAVAAIEEERRLFYVGVTRARRHLWLSWGLARGTGGGPVRRRSRFVNGVAPEGGTGRRDAGNRGGRRARGGEARCRVCGGRLLGTMAVKLGRCGDCPAEVDDALLDRLREWRGERARELRVPFYVVLTDATMHAIAEQRPPDRAALVAIPGIGSDKLARFGDEVLSLVNADFGETGSR